MQSGGEGLSLSVLELQKDSCETTNSSTSALWLQLLVKTEVNKDEEESDGRGRTFVILQAQFIRNYI